LGLGRINSESYVSLSELVEDSAELGLGFSGAGFGISSSDSEDIFSSTSDFGGGFRV